MIGGLIASPQMRASSTPSRGAPRPVLSDQNSDDQDDEESGQDHDQQGHRSMLMRRIEPAQARSVAPKRSMPYVWRIRRGLWSPLGARRIGPGSGRRGPPLDAPGEQRRSH